MLYEDLKLVEKLLEGDEYFIGGWIEVGQSIIQPVTEDMLLVVPEGTYDVRISNKGNDGTKKRNPYRADRGRCSRGNARGYL